MPSNLDPHDAALWALIAISLVVVGFTIATPLSLAERGSVLAAIAAILIGIGWRVRRGRNKGGDDDTTE